MSSPRRTNPDKPRDRPGCDRRRVLRQPRHEPRLCRYGDALGTAVVVALGFVALAATVGVVDLVRTRHRTRAGMPRTQPPDR